MSNKDKCSQWKLAPLINPVTNRKIKADGPTYNKLKKDCDEKSPKTKCSQWKLAPLINPVTNRKIKADGPTYNKLKKDCDETQLTLPFVPNVKKTDVNVKKITIVKKDLDLSDFLDNRLVNEANVLSSIDKTNISQWDMCINGKHSNFRESLTNVSVLGRGTFGEVYKVNLKGVSFVVKEAYVSKDEEYKVKRKGVGKLSKNSYSYEFNLLNLVRKLIKKDKSPNFLFAYDLAVCEGCKMRDGPVGICYLTFMEPGDGDLYDYTRKDVLPEDTMWSILYQMLMAVHVMHSTYGIVHKDIKSDNFLIKRVKPGGYIKYNIQNSVYSETFLVRNNGIFVLISDFGVSESVSPKYTINGYTGTRNAKVIKIGSNVVFQPIICKNRIYSNKIVPSNKDNIVEWSDDTISTGNKTFNYFPVESLIPNEMFDLNDLVRYPAFDFFYDIMDVIHLFIGGKRMLSEGDHRPFLGVPQSMITKLNQVNAVNNKLYYDRSNTWSIVAGLMLKKLYTNRVQDTDNLIATY